jgi:hypothetical protein
LGQLENTRELYLLRSDTQDLSPTPQNLPYVSDLHHFGKAEAIHTYPAHENQETQCAAKMAIYFQTPEILQENGRIQAVYFQTREILNEDGQLFRDSSKIHGHASAF